MRILITGSSGHLGEALVRTLRNTSHRAVGLDIVASEFTSAVGSITDRSYVRQGMDGVDAVIHAATLHKPHIVLRARQDFVDTNVTGTLNLLEEAVLAGVRSFVFTSTTSAFGEALIPPAGAPAAWVTEDVTPVPRNIYGVTKTAAEDLCELFHRRYRLACIVLRTSRFFPEEDDHLPTRQAYEDANVKANEYLYRRVDIEDAANAHLAALERAPAIGFGRYIISATTPFLPEDLSELRANAPFVVRRRVPGYEEVYAQRGWKMFPTIDRVYVNERARKDLGWHPRYDFGYVLDCLKAGEDPRSPLSRTVGSKGYDGRSGLRVPRGEVNVTELPFNKFLGLQPAEPPQVLRLPAGGQYLNHLGTVHASAQLALAEASSGEFLLRQIGPTAGVVPVVRRFEARFRKPANGAITSTVTTPAEAIDQFRAALAAKRRALISVAVELHDQTGAHVLSASIEWFITRIPNETSHA